MGFVSISYWHYRRNRLYDCNNPVIAEGAESETPLNAQSPSQVGEERRKKEMNYQEVRKKAKEFKEVSKELDDRLIKIANMTWQTIAGDIFDCIGKDTMKRSEVIECVGDADYMFTHGNDPEAYAYFLYLFHNNEKHLQKVMKQAFPYAKYC